MGCLRHSGSSGSDPSEAVGLPRVCLVPLSLSQSTGSLHSPRPVGIPRVPERTQRGERLNARPAVCVTRHLTGVGWLYLLAPVNSTLIWFALIFTVPTSGRLPLPDHLPLPAFLESAVKLYWMFCVLTKDPPVPLLLSTE